MSLFAERVWEDLHKVGSLASLCLEDAGALLAQCDFMMELPSTVDIEDTVSLGQDKEG